MDYQIVPLTREMLPDLVALEQSCFSHPWTETMFRNDLENPVALYRVVLFEGAPVAYMGLWQVADEGQITNVAVSPGHRRHGLAKRLIGEMVVLSKGAGLSLLTLEVRESNTPAIKLYESLGFQKVGLRKNYYEGKENALLYTLFLEN